MSKALIVFSVLLLSVSSVVPLEWRNDPSSDSSWEIAVSSVQSYTWYEARDICLSEGGDLLFQFDIDSVVRHILNASELITDVFWSGINRLRNFSKWEWGPHDEPVPSTFPYIDYIGDGKCVCISFVGPILEHNYKLREWVGLFTQNCGKPLYQFICKRKKGESTPLVLPPPIIPNTNCPEGWRDAGTNRCYKVFEDPKKYRWRDAREACTSLPYYNPNLACANTPEEIDVLTRLVTYPYSASFWFGLIVKNHLSNFAWMWSDSTRFTMNVTNFHRELPPRYARYPYPTDEGMVIDNRAVPEGAWNFVGVSLRGYICQVEKDPNYNHTVSILERTTVEHDGNID